MKYIKLFLILKNKFLFFGIIFIIYTYYLDINIYRVAIVFGNIILLAKSGNKIPKYNKC